MALVIGSRLKYDDLIGGDRDGPDFGTEVKLEGEEL